MKHNGYTSDQVFHAAPCRSRPRIGCGYNYCLKASVNEGNSRVERGPTGPKKYTFYAEYPLLAYVRAYEEDKRGI